MLGCSLRYFKFINVAPDISNIDYGALASRLFVMNIVLPRGLTHRGTSNKEKSPTRFKTFGFMHRPINGKPHPPHLRNTLGVGRGFVLISVPHGWGIFLQVTAQFYTFSYWI